MTDEYIKTLSACFTLMVFETLTNWTINQIISKTTWNEIFEKQASCNHPVISFQSVIVMLDSKKSTERVNVIYFILGWY